MKLQKVLMAAVCIFAFTACSNEIEGSSGEVTMPSSNYYYTLPKECTSVVLPSSFTGKDVFLIYSNPSNHNEYSNKDSVTGGYDNIANRSATTEYKRTVNYKATYLGNGTYRDEITFELPEELRNYKNNKNVSRAANDNETGGKLNYYNPALENVTVGDEVDFWYSAGDSKYLGMEDYTFEPEETDIYNAGEYIRSGKFKLMKEGRKCRIWVLNNNWKYINTDTAFTDYDEVAEVIDSVYEKVTDIFGSNVVNGGIQVITADENTKLEVLVYDLMGDAQYTANGGTYGFFRGLDFWQNGYLLSDASKKHLAWSNECQSINIDSSFLKTNTKVSISTLIHEFQHLLNYCNKNSEYQTWYTEMLSMSSEDVFMNNIGLNEEAGPMNRLFNGYFGKTHQGFGNWGKGNDVYFSYANAYAFGAYLMRNYGGIDLIHEIATNSFVDKDSITAALKTLGYNETFDSVFKKFGITFIYPESCSYYSFNKEISQTINGVNYTLIPIDLDKYHFYIGKFYDVDLSEPDKPNKVKDWINKNLYLKDPEGDFVYWWWGDQTTFHIEQPKIYLNSYKLNEAIQPYGFAVYYLGKAGQEQTYTIEKNSNLTMTIVVK